MISLVRCASVNLITELHIIQGKHKDRQCNYRGADKYLARPTSGCILFDGENISFDTSLVMYKNSTNIPPIMIIYTGVLIST